MAACDYRFSLKYVSNDKTNCHHHFGSSLELASKTIHYLLQEFVSNNENSLETNELPSITEREFHGLERDRAFIGLAFEDSG